VKRHRKKEKTVHLSINPEGAKLGLYEGVSKRGDGKHLAKNRC